MKNKSIFGIVANMFKRYMRLVPIILLSNLFCWCLMKLRLYFVDYGSFYKIYDLDCTILRPVRKAFWDVFRGTNSFTSTFWTMEPQIKGLILASFSLMLELRISGKIRILINSMVMLVVYLLKIDAGSYILCLLAGTICYEIVQILNNNIKASSFIESHNITLIILTFLTMEFIVLYQRIGNIHDYLDYTYLCWIPWIILFPTLLISGRGFLKKLLENKYLVRLGGCSFAVYGVHEIIWHSLGYVMVSRIGGELTVMEATFVYIWCWIATLFVAAVITMLNNCIQRKAVNPLFSLIERHVKTYC